LQADADAEEGLVSGDVVVDGGQVASVGKGFEAVAEMTDAREDYFLGPETLVVSLSRTRKRSSTGGMNNCKEMLTMSRATSAQAYMLETPAQSRELGSMGA
jgi:hypothetical protein